MEIAKRYDMIGEMDVLRNSRF